MYNTTIQNFLENEYSNSALYDCYRSIANYIDGLKPSSRKVVYTVKKQNIVKDSKVSRLASAVAMETQYLHGEGSLQGVIIGLTQDFVGSNNMPLLSPNGNFGTRFIPASSAARYIYSKKSPVFDFIFHKEDDKILFNQEFEGEKIEPKFYVPILPILLINGSEGMGTGFAQKILPRNPKDIIEALNDIIKTGDTRKQLKPFYNEFKGKILTGETENSWVIKGNLEIVDSNTILITELPIGYSLASYLKVLHKLEDNNKIKNFTDESEDDNFLFRVDVKRSLTKKPYESLLEFFKLKKRVTENFTCIDEENKIRIFDSAKDVLKSYYTIKLSYYEKRRQNILYELDRDLNYLSSMLFFVKGVIENSIDVLNKKKSVIEKDLDKNQKIISKDNSYDYLLKMPIHSLTFEKVKDLEKKVEGKKKSYKEYKNSSASSLWKKDLCQLSL